MSIRALAESPLRAVYSVTATARSCGFSRARWYELIDLGVMPPPVYDLLSRRPLYTAQLHEECLRVRTTYIGWNGRYFMFHERRTQPTSAGHTKTGRRRATLDTQMTEVMQNLRALGVTATDAQIAAAVATCYPTGLPPEDFEGAIRAIFLHLRRQSQRPT